MSAIGPTASSTGMEAPTTKAQTLGKDDFLKLLVAQLQHQDPLKPMDDTQFMAQMAQFSTLEQITNVGDELKRLSFSGQVGQAVALIGRTVTYEQKDGTSAQGTVDGVDMQDGKILLAVNGEKIEPGVVRSVA